MTWWAAIIIYVLMGVLIGSILEKERLMTCVWIWPYILGLMIIESLCIAIKDSWRMAVDAIKNIKEK